MNTQKSRIEQLKLNGYKLNFETSITQIFENYRKIALYAGLSLFVFGIILITLIYGGLLSYFGIETITEMTKPENLRPENLSKEFLMWYTIFAILFTSFVSPFSAGFIKMAYCADRDEEFRLSAIFTYYSSSKFFTLFTATLIISLTNTGLATIAEQLGNGAAGSVASLFISFYTILTVPLIIFGDLGVFSAIQTSVALIAKQPLLILGLLLISLIATLLGLMFIIVGILFTMPFIYSFYYILYKNIVGFEE
ncbi:hypothetical protein FFWV33_16205 [Flavobacterium faecale]|uniref:Beta-carotene 15,15'-monooxygenase n=1 Tax=Flavobacterium faecale TaxID=1355330 RepID=A0A2S1LGX9_9FLAO|nr:hypothetical protein [Flavobacterium faecale]AWG22958.1 hypothetical protein FFWV33_16205 [Flavobacterium faecale]